MPASGACCWPTTGRLFTPGLSRRPPPPAETLTLLHDHNDPGMAPSPPTVRASPNHHHHHGRALHHHPTAPAPYPAAMRAPPRGTASSSRSSVQATHLRLHWRHNRCVWRGAPSLNGVTRACVTSICHLLFEWVWQGKAGPRQEVGRRLRQGGGSACAGWRLAWHRCRQKTASIACLAEASALWGGRLRRQSRAASNAQNGLMWRGVVWWVLGPGRKLQALS